MAISRKKKTIFIILGSLIVLLVLLHLLLPSILLKYVNRQLTRIDGYSGHIEDIGVNLFRGAYTIHGIKLDRTGGKIPVPFFKADLIDLSVEWKALLRGKVVAEIEVDNPVLNFVKGPTKETSQTKVDKDWQDVVDKLIPFKLNRFQLNNGETHFRNYHTSPKVDILASDIQLVAENLTNAKRQKETLPSSVKGTASVYDGKATLDMKLDALSKEPKFDMNVRLTTVQLTNLNDFIKAYGNFDVEKGTISLYTEAAAKNNRIEGYTKPVIKDLKVSNWKEDKDKPLKAAWESVIEAVGWILNNKKEDQIATRAKFEGSFRNPDVNTWSIIGQLLRNAFIEALFPALENSISLKSVESKEEKKTLLQKIFGKNDDKENNIRESDDKNNKKKDEKKKN